MTAAADAPRVHPDARRSRLRTIMGTLERELDGLASDGGAAAERASVLRVAWRELGKALDLGPEPAVRTCPVCGAICMHDATLCSECWSALVP